MPVNDLAIPNDSTTTPIAEPVPNEIVTKESESSISSLISTAIHKTKKPLVPTITDTSLKKGKGAKGINLSDYKIVPVKKPISHKPLTCSWSIENKMRNTTKLKAILKYYHIDLSMKEEDIMVLNLIHRETSVIMSFEDASYSKLMAKAYSHLQQTLKKALKK